MKTTILTTLALIFISLTSLSAQNVAVYSNVETTENGCQKEYISYNQDAGRPLTKTVFVEDTDGTTLNKTVYKWNQNKWEALQKTEYKYNDDRQPVAIVFTKWDNTKNTWDSKAEHLSYTYDNKGEYMAMLQTSVNNTSDLLTAK